MIFACNLMLSPARAKEPDAIPTADYVSTVWASYTATASSFPTQTVTPSPIPTFTDVPTLIPTLISSATPEPVSINTNQLVTQTFALSFYDPHIGFYFPDIASINCLQFDFDLGDCVSKVHHGQDDYYQWIGKGAACTSLLVYDTVFRVLSPAHLEGVWRCIDVGALDVNGLHYIDFMLSYPDMIWTGTNLDDFPWSSDVVIEILSVP